MSEKYFTVDARAMLTWGRDSIKDHTTAVLELVKNSYDAGAKIVEVVIFAGSENKAERMIRIADDGSGMTAAQLETNWLRIGFSEKLESKKGRFGRRKTGEKGVGRISADRLGSKLQLKSQARNSSATGLEVDWTEFDQGGRALSEIPIPFLVNPTFDICRPSVFDKKKKVFLATAPRPNSRNQTGTELTITDLRHKWSANDIAELRHELSVLTPPFEPVIDFQIRVQNDLDSDLNGVLLSPFYETAEIEGDFSYSGNGTVTYRIKDRDEKGRVRKAKTIETNWAEFVHAPIPSQDDGGDVDGVDGDSEVTPTCGPLDVKLLFYPRDEQTLRGTELSLKQLKEFLDTNVGVKVYRDNVRVMPYGSVERPEGDWLGLGERKARSPAGAARKKDFRVGPNQIVGAVFLTRDRNPGLIDTSGREGLVHSDAFIELKSFLLSGCFPTIEARYHEIFTARRKEDDDPSPRETIREVNEGLTELTKSLNTVGTELPKRASQKIEVLRNQIKASRDRLQRLQRSSEELASQATIYRGLATLGITAATFGHETEIALQSCLTSVDVAYRLLRGKPTVSEDAIKELAKAIEFGKRISAWGAFTLKRVRRDKRQKRSEDVTKLITELVDGLKEAFDASTITLRSRFQAVEGETFPMDVESVALNLLTNAYYFAKQNRKERHVSITLRNARRLGEKGFELAVGDSGPGVRQEMRNQIWEPLFSTKVDAAGRPFGTGLGLSIIDSVVKDMGGVRTVDMDPELKGARFTVWLKLG